MLLWRIVIKIMTLKRLQKHFQRKHKAHKVDYSCYACEGHYLNIFEGKFIVELLEKTTLSTQSIYSDINRYTPF